MIFNCILSMTTWFNFIQYYSDLYQNISQISEILRHYVHIQEMFLQTCLMWSRCDNICSMLIPSFFELAFPTLQHKTKYKYRNVFQIKALSLKLKSVKGEHCIMGVYLTAVVSLASRSSWRPEPG